jgi:outer membrane receptor protein involved in Fe transport
VGELQVPKRAAAEFLRRCRLLCGLAPGDGARHLYFTPAFITFDAKIAYETPRWSLALVGKNLADTRYFQPFPASLGMIAPGEPLTVYVIATAKY